MNYYGSKAEVYHGTAKYTKGGLSKSDLIRIKDKYGNFRYKSKKQQKQKNSFRAKWSNAMKKARKQLIKEGVIKAETGFIPVGGKTKEGKALLKRIRELV